MIFRFLETYSPACTQREDGEDRQAQTDRDHDAAGAAQNHAAVSATADNC